jgi:hypothetical protein
LHWGSARGKASTYTQNKRTQTSVPRVVFEPTTPVFERTKTVHSLDRAAWSLHFISLSVVNLYPKPLIKFYKQTKELYKRRCCEFCALHIMEPLSRYWLMACVLNPNREYPILSLSRRVILLYSYRSCYLKPSDCALRR